MATKKKTRKKQVKAKRTAGKKAAPKKVVQKKLARKVMKKKAPQRRAAVRAKAAGKRTTSGRTITARKNQVRRKTKRADAVAFSLDEPVSRSGGQAGDLQGLPSLAGADSESVGELLEEGNAFEADAVMGVENAGEAEGKEVRTHEVPEDDVPGEYLDKE